MDVLCKFKVFELLMNGNHSMLRLSNGFIPVGRISSLSANLKSHLSNLSNAQEATSAVPLCNKFSKLGEVDLSAPKQANSRAKL